MGLFGRKAKKLPEENTALMEIPQVEPTEEVAPEIELAQEIESTSEELNLEREASLKESERIILGVNKELVNKLKEKVEKVRNEKNELTNKYKELVEEVKSLNTKFDSLKTELVAPFMEEARKELNEVIHTQKSRVAKNEDEILKLSKAQEEFEFVSSFQDYYQLIKLCIYMITHTEASNHSMIKLLLNTVHSLSSDMIRNNFWSAGKDAIITSLLNLKTYWRLKDTKIEELIGNQINALENLR